MCVYQTPAFAALESWEHMRCPVEGHNFIFHLMALLTEMVQGFKELKTDTEVSGFTNWICAVKNRSEWPTHPHTFSFGSSFHFPLPLCLKIRSCYYFLMKPVCWSYLVADLVVCNLRLCYFFLRQIQLAGFADSFAQTWHQSSSGKSKFYTSQFCQKEKSLQLAFLSLREKSRKDETPQ